jgi:hypothetical protein
VASAPNAKLDTQGKFTGSAHARRGNGLRGGKPDAFMRPWCNEWRSGPHGERSDFSPSDQAAFAVRPLAFAGVFGAPFAFTSAA